MQYIIEKQRFLSNLNAQEAAKKFVQLQINPVYLSGLKHDLTEFKGITLHKMIDHVMDRYPAKPEEVIAQQNIFTKPWDVNEHIEYLYE